MLAFLSLEQSYQLEDGDCLVLPICKLSLQALTADNSHFSCLTQQPVIFDYIQQISPLTQPNQLSTLSIMVAEKRVNVIAFNIEQQSLKLDSYLVLIERLYQQIRELGASRIVFDWQYISAKGLDQYWQTRHLVERFNQLNYRFYLPNKQLPALEPITCLVSGASVQGLEHGTAIAQGQWQTRQLCDLPANICTPSYIAQCAVELAQQYSSVDVNLLDENDMHALGMNSLLSVGQGSEQASKLVVINYQGTSAAQQPIVLVGKGITFDTGGNCIKQREPMALMKYDMGGAGAVFGTMKALAELGLTLNVTAVLACAENMLGSNATRPGDVVVSMSGKSIEIVNTDAEGRLVLCDALTYAERFNPETVINVATLTGATMAALGRGYSALIANDQELAKELLSAGQTANDKAWQLPLPIEELPQLETPYADLSNMGDGSAGCIIAALFLSQFTENYRWAHLDVSSTAKVKSPTKAATGRPVALLCQYLLDRTKSL